jgi:hypothetical protein
MSAAEAKPAPARKASRKIVAAGRGVFLTADWTPGEDGIQAAIDAGMTEPQLHDLAEQFRQYYIRKGSDPSARRDNWPAVWRYWVKNNYPSVAKPVATPTPAPGPRPIAEIVAPVVANAIAGHEEVVKWRGRSFRVITGGAA